MKILIQTQFRENYGAHCWDGTGECPQYWKNKGGNEYLIPDLSIGTIMALGQKGLTELVHNLAKVKGVVKCNDYCQEYIIDWSILENNELTPEQKIAIEAYNEGYSYSPSTIIL